jgi:nitroimidazol reductase NimA-like FMN-containing flavoprotein (pyridoxamine 5'-phosphate oxidase superfamily)
VERTLDVSVEENTMAKELRPPELRDLDRGHCLALLATQRIGRLVLPGPDPFVAPINYVVVDEAVIYRSDEGSPAAGAHGSRVVFEVDVVDEGEHAGWSVVVRGTVEDVTDLLKSDLDWHERLAPWAPGPKDRWLRVDIEEVTGRLLLGAEQPSAMDPRGYL